MLDAAATGHPPLTLHSLAAQGFLFATGVENSAPTIQNGRIRHDPMAECGHCDRCREDFALVREIGCSVLRYGPQIHATLRAPELHDWSFADESFAELKRLGILPAVDLCHFGLPDSLGDFQNPDFPEVFANYAQAFAARFPWASSITR